MSQWHLTLKVQPSLRLDLRSINPSTLAQLSRREIEHLPLPSGNRLAPLGEWFGVQALDSDQTDLLIEGDLSQVDRIGWQLAAGHVRLQGPVGDYLGAAMTGGHLTVNGDVGDFAASTLPGSMDGMRGGQLVVHGNAGNRLADRMRRGTVVVFGDVGDLLASRMVAGTVAVAGRCGVHAAWGMRRGSIVFAGPAPRIAPTFAPVDSNADVFWQLLARDLARFGGAFAGLAQRRVVRHAGDLAVLGKGELLLPA